MGKWCVCRSGGALVVGAVFISEVGAFFSQLVFRNVPYIFSFLAILDSLYVGYASFVSRTRVEFKEDSSGRITTCGKDLSPVAQNMWDHLVVNVGDDMLLHITCCLIGWCALWQLWLFWCGRGALDRLAQASAWSGPLMVPIVIYIAIAGISDFLVYPVASMKEILKK